MSVPAKPFIGVATTTPIAFMSSGVLSLERMAVLSEEGCGVFCVELPLQGSTLQVVFRLSTGAHSVRCDARVEALFPTTPGGLELRARLGEREFNAVISSNPGDSATMMFRMADLESAHQQKKPQKPVQAPRPSGPGRAPGFCLRFVNLDEKGKAAVARHVKISRQTGELLSRRGEGMVQLGEDDRKTLASAFDVDNLSKKALDW